MIRQRFRTSSGRSDGSSAATASSETACSSGCIIVADSVSSPASRGVKGRPSARASGVRSRRVDGTGPRLLCGAGCRRGTRSGGRCGLSKSRQNNSSHASSHEQEDASPHRQSCAAGRLTDTKWPLSGTGGIFLASLIRPSSGFRPAVAIEKLHPCGKTAH